MMRHWRPRAIVVVDHPLDRARGEHVAGLGQQRSGVDRGLDRRSPSARRGAPRSRPPRGRRSPWGRRRATVWSLIADDFDAAMRRAPAPRASRRCRTPARSRSRRAGSTPSRSMARKDRNATPWPVASRRPSVPPEPTGLPVTISGTVIALIHGIGVHEPGHHLLVGAHVRRHHVDARADERDHLLHVAARQVFQFAQRQRVGIDRDAALAAAVGQIGERAFPAHPDRQRRDLADVDVGARSACRLWRGRASDGAARDSP